MANGNGKHWPGDDEDTPVERPHGRRERLVIPANPPPHVVLPPPIRTDPPVAIARVYKTAIVSVWALTVVGVLAAIQHWPYEVSLGAIGMITGVWTLGSILGKRP